MFEVHITCLGHTNRKTVLANAIESLCLCVPSIAPGPNKLLRRSQYLIIRLEPTLQLDQHAYNTLSSKLSKTEGLISTLPCINTHRCTLVRNTPLKLLAFSSFFFSVE